MRSRSVAASIAIVATALSACQSDGKPTASTTRPTSASSTTPGKSGAVPAFYRVPDPLPDSAPGTLLKSEKVAAPNIHGTVYRVMYTSLSVRGHTVPVTGLIMIPRAAAPSGGYPVVTWAHGTTGLADLCAPSLSPTSAPPPPANPVLDRGWELASTDYYGQGTPGVLPYLSGVSAARNTIDIVRAARQLEVAHASTNYVVAGYSEGGQTAMFALDIGAAYAPELHLKGVAAGAPPSQFDRLYDFLKAGPHRFYLLMLVVGLNAAYGDDAAPLDEVLTPKGLGIVPDVEQGCITIPQYGLLQPKKKLLQYKLADVSIASTFKADPFTVPKWRSALAANDPQSFTAARAAPLLIVQGDADEQVPATSTRLLVEHECALGQQLELWIYPGLRHGATLVAATEDVTSWIGNRFAGAAATEPYVPKGAKNIARTNCPA